MASALEFLNKVMKKKVIVFLLSDFITSDYTKSLQVAAKRHDLTGIRLYDLREEVLPNVGIISVKDAESEEVVLIDTASERVRNQYMMNYRKRVSDFETIFRKSGAGTISCHCNESYITKLLYYFKKRT